MIKLTYNGFALKSEFHSRPAPKALNIPSAEGAEYDSQGQALSGARRVAPGTVTVDREALKERNKYR